MDEDIAHTWMTITNSMAQMPYDAVKYKSKLNNSSLLTTPKLNDSTAATTTAALTPLNLNGSELEQRDSMMI